MNAQDKTTKFEAGKVYQARAIGDWESVSEIKVVKVTAKMMAFEHNGETMRRKIDQRENCQRVQVSAGRSAYSNHIVEEESVEAKSNKKETVEPEIDVAEVAIENKKKYTAKIIARDGKYAIKVGKNSYVASGNGLFGSIALFNTPSEAMKGCCHLKDKNWNIIPYDKELKDDAPEMKIEKHDCEPAAEVAAETVMDIQEAEEEGRQSTRNIVAAIKESNQDFEYYPTTQEMLDCIRRDMQKGVDQKSYSVLEVGAGTAFAGKFLAGKERVFAIEKSEILRASWPCDVIPVGTDFDNLSIMGIKAEVCFCNPPYSVYEAWAARIINEFSGGRIYLVIPQRWENSDLIKLAIEDRKASFKVIFSGDFLEAERSARAKVDIVCIDLRQGEYGSRRFTKVDPFELWYEKEFKQKPEQTQDEQKINIDIDEASQVVTGESYIERISSLYSAELKTLQEAFQSINGLSGKVFKLLNLSRGSLCEALKAEINGIRAKYWNELFKKYKPISSRLTSHGLKCLRGKFSAQESIDFTVENILAATVWAIKYANEMNSEQLEVFVLQLFDKANIINYKSNQRTFEKDDWRYSRHEEAKSYSHYGLDYRIVLDRVMPFPYREGFSFSYDYPNGLSKRCHDLVNDLLVISRNLGYESDGVTSYHHDWNPGNKKNFYLKNGDTAFTVKGYIKGTMHFQINQEIMRAMNVEFGRLKGWIKDKRQAAEELGISEAEAEKAWGSLASLMPPVPSLMLGM